MKKYKTYLFDFDGTLVDSHDSLYRVFEGSYASVGIKITKENVLRLMRVRLQQGYEELRAPWEKVDIFAKKIVELLDDEETLKLTKIYSDTLSVLNKLKKEGATLGIVTSNSKKHTQDVLKFMNIDEKLFDVIVGNLEVKNHKPSPDPVLKALEILNIDNNDVCYVGDGLDDMRCAKAAKVDAILIDRLNEYKDDNDIIIKSLEELLNA